MAHEPLDFKTLFELAPNLYLVLAPDFTILGVSHAYLQATMVKQEDILGRDIFDVFPDNPNDPMATGTKNLRASLERVLSSKASDTMAVQKYDIRRPESEGGGFEERYWSPVNSPILGAHHEVRYIVHRVEDVTEFIRLKQLENEQQKIAEELRTRANQMEMEIFRRAQELQETNKQLRAANEQLDAFSYSISHDLRAPLRAISGFAGILSKEYSSQFTEEAQKMLQNICDNAAGMGQLINDLLAFSRMGRQSIHKQKVDITNLFHKALEPFMQEKVDRQIDVVIHTLPPCYADVNLLAQVLLNLVGNAFKYTRKQTKARIEIGFQQKGADTVYFVKDNGAGFDMQYVDKLFGVFQRLHSASEYEGTGVGLAIAQRIIYRHGGKIWAEAEVGKGASFSFTLGQE